MGRKNPSTTDLTEQSLALADFAVTALAAAEQSSIEKQSVEGFPLNPDERAVAAELSTLSNMLKKKLAKQDSAFTIADTVSVLLCLAVSLRDEVPVTLVRRLLIAKKLIDCLQANLVSSASGKAKKARKSQPTDTLYQFKITLLDAKPAIWRRIQVQDCTLDKFHEHIQTAMGWTNSHLHQFEIKGARYGDPELLDDDFEDFECVDSTTTNLSDILPKSGKRFTFKYEYDFGDGWGHEVVFEGNPPSDPKVKYPLCLEGERACPPEDCGGVWGYVDFLEAIGNKKHAQHRELLRWIGGRFDSEAFDAKKATKEMRKGLPDWRRE